MEAPFPAVFGPARRAVQGGDAAISLPGTALPSDRAKVSAAVSLTRELILCSSDNVEDIIPRDSTGRRIRRANRRFHHPGGASSGPLPLDGPRLAGLGLRPTAGRRASTNW